MKKTDTNKPILAGLIIPLTANTLAAAPILSMKKGPKSTKSFMDEQIMFNDKATRKIGPHYNPSNDNIHSVAKDPSQLSSMESGVTAHEIGHAKMNRMFGNLMVVPNLLRMASVPAMFVAPVAVATAKDKKEAKQRAIISSIPGGVQLGDELAASVRGSMSLAKRGKIKAIPFAFAGIPSYAAIAAPGAVTYHFKKKSLEHGPKRHSKS